MNPQSSPGWERLLQQHALPEHYRAMVREHWQPLADAIAIRAAHAPQLIGVNGAQGTGKSTLSAMLEALLRERGVATVTLSIDDLYLRRSERQTLAGRVHPLLRTRGVPGTHDMALGAKVIESLLHGRGDVAVPRFNKANDDRQPEAAWPVYHAPQRVVIFEGWCIGTPPQTEEALHQPVNALEAEDDRDGRWRAYVNRMLATTYHAVFQQLDELILLAAPDFEAVYAWRGKQEEQLRQAHPTGRGVMDAAALQRFIQHYERLTRHNLAVLPGLADRVYRFDRNHRIIAVNQRKPHV